MNAYKDATTVRRLRLQQLIKEMGGEYGGQVAISRRTGIKPTYISAMASDNIRSPMGDRAARRIEAGCGKPWGWLDSRDEAAEALEVVQRIIALVPPDAWNPLTAQLVVRMADIALKEGWDEPTLGAKVKEYLRLTG